jgi:anthranilate synthase component I
MYYPSLSEFRKLAKSGNLIPVYREILADLETPVSAFMKISQGASYAYLLESVEGQEKIGRYSFLGANPSLVFKSKGKKVCLVIDGRETEIKSKKDPLDNLKEIMCRYKPVKVKGLPRFFGGMVGYISYDMVRFFEELPDENPDDLDLSDSTFMLTDTLLIFDHIEHSIKIVSNATVKDNSDEAYRIACSKIEFLAKKLREPLKNRRQVPDAGCKEKTKLKSNFTKNEFEKIVRGAKEYIYKGDIIQTVLSQRIETKINSDPLNVYRALRIVNPSPYMYYLKMDDLNVIGSSPEVFLRVEDGIATVRPIAGTRPRGINEKEDGKLETQLLSDKKERAEHVMLVDLGRNDLGRVCEYGSVKLSEDMIVEKYSHVMHIVSEITGKLRRGKDGFDCVRACFPAGTVSGAPKIRAMEIIDELESVKRGPYAGAVGYFSFSGNLDTCITIRTILMNKTSVYIQAGAGIVADSIPENEYQETLNKAKALLRAIKMAQEGLD